MAIVSKNKRYLWLLYQKTIATYGYCIKKSLLNNDNINGDITTRVIPVLLSPCQQCIKLVDHYLDFITHIDQKDLRNMVYYFNDYFYQNFLIDFSSI